MQAGLFFLPSSYDGLSPHFRSPSPSSYQLWKQARPSLNSAVFVQGVEPRTLSGNRCSIRAQPQKAGDVEEKHKRKRITEDETAHSYTALSRSRIAQIMHYRDSYMPWSTAGNQRASSWLWLILAQCVPLLLVISRVAQKRRQETSLMRPVQVSCSALETPGRFPVH